MSPEQDQQPPANNNYQPRPEDTPQPQPQSPQTQEWPQTAQQQPQQPQPQQQEQAVRYQPVEQAPQYAPAQSVPQQPLTEDPGKVFSILGIVAAFIFMQLPGLILSIIGYKKSKKAGRKTTLGTIGIWLNAVGLILTAAAIALFTWAAYTGIQQRSVDTSQDSAAMAILKKAEVYSSLNSAGKYAYPTIEQLRSGPAESTLTEEESAKIKDTDKPTGDEIGYKTCTDESGLIIGAETYIYSEGFGQAVPHGTAGSCGIEE